MPFLQVTDQRDSDLLADSFRSSLPLPPALEPTLEEALRHVLDNPGSLIRPRLVLQMARAYGFDPALGRDLAMALEYFHTASLLFDDLPCMDNALERRGVPCTHLVFGQAGAILSALALINRAYALVWRAASSCRQQDQSRAFAFVEQCLGVEGLLNGQSLDLHYSSLPQTRETTEMVARGKTVSLIRLTLVLPAMLGGAAPRELQLMERIAMFWGLSYQSVDDLKDVLQSAEESGKTPARDALLGRPNIAMAMGTRKAVQRLTRFIALGDKALRGLLALRPEMGFLGKLRNELEAELRRVTEDAGELVAGASA